MSVIRFEHADFECEVAAGTRLIDVTDDHPAADVPYSCRSASCGTCRVEVLAGMDALSPPEDDEREVLAIFGDDDRVRLCCQLWLVKDGERVVLRLADY